MAIGKCSDDTDIDQDARRDPLRRRPRCTPSCSTTTPSPALSAYMRSDHVVIHVSLQTGDAEATVYGCDLSDEYVRFNADYTT